jgi:thiamine monophosphate synthase
MLLIESRHVATQTGAIHVKVGGERSPISSPIVDVNVDRIREAIEGGVSILQIRVSTRELVVAAAITQKLDRARSRLLMFYRMIDIPSSSGAAAPSFGVGTHLPDNPPPGFSQVTSIQAMRSRPDGESQLISKAVHSLDAALQAERDGADMLIFGTVFPSSSHPEAPAAGLDALHEISAAAAIPVIAIGGITAHNAGDCIAAGAAGVAVISAIHDAPDPREAAAKLRAAIGPLTPDH